MSLWCLFGRHAWTLGVRGTIPGTEMHPPGSGAILPSWTDIEVRMYHCIRCERVRAVATWVETAPYKADRVHRARLSVAWALWQLAAEVKK